MITVLYKT